MKTGALIVGATRGNGKIGEKVTANLSVINSIPNQLPNTHSIYSTYLSSKSIAPQTIVEIRGEVYMKLSIFKQFKGDFANPRNLSAGAIRLKNTEKSKSYQLSFVAYDILFHHLKSRDNIVDIHETEDEKLQLLKALEFQIPKYNIVDENSMHHAFAIFTKHITKLDFEVDGYVYKANDLNEQRRLASTAHHPRYAIAYKIQGDSKVSRILNILWQVSRTGTLTPVAHINPITLSGAEISRVTLHHAGMIAKHDIAIGDDVLVTRRGGVIPKIELVTSRDGRATDISSDDKSRLPKHCPICHTQTLSTGDVLKCGLSDECPEAIEQYLIFFAKTLGMQGFGPRVVKACVEAKLLRTAGDFYRLSAADLAGLDRLGEKSAANLITEVEATRTIDFAVFLHALGLTDVGKQLAQLLANHYQTLSRLQLANSTELAQLPGVADIVATKIIEGLAAKETIIADILSETSIRANISTTQPTHKERTHLFSGKSVVFTGKLNDISRQKAQEHVKQLGGTTPSQISTRTDYLVVGAGGGGGSKRAKAEKLAITILSENEFMTLIS